MSGGNTQDERQTSRDEVPRAETQKGQASWVIHRQVVLGAEAEPLSKPGQ